MLCIQMMLFIQILFIGAAYYSTEKSVANVWNVIMVTSSQKSNPFMAQNFFFSKYKGMTQGVSVIFNYVLEVLRSYEHFQMNYWGSRYVTSAFALFYKAFCYVTFNFQWNYWSLHGHFVESVNFSWLFHGITESFMDFSWNWWTFHCFSWNW